MRVFHAIPCSLNLESGNLILRESRREREKERERVREREREKEGEGDREEGE